MSNGKEEESPKKISRLIKKGSLLPAVVTPSKEVVDFSKEEKNIMTPTFKLSNMQFIMDNVHETTGWQTIFSESFEGSFPSTNWTTFANSGYTSAYWKDVNNLYYNGLWSAWCASAGSSGITSTNGYYLPNMMSWMIYGPFDLSDATAATLSLFLNSQTESEYDFFKWMVSVDGKNYYGYQTSGSTTGWEYKSLDFTNIPTLGNVCGYSQVYVGLLFTSDASNSNYAGSFVDDVLIEKYRQTLPNLNATSIYLSSENWNVGNVITAGLSVDNLGNMSAGPHYSDLYLSTNTTITTSDTYLGEIYFSNILGDSSSTEYTTINVPYLNDGTYYVGCMLDVYNNVFESDESDNIEYRIAAVTIDQFPDLSWTALTLSSDIWTVGSTIFADLTEQNTGSAVATGHFTDLYLSTNEYISESDTYLGELYFSSVPAYGSALRSVSFTVPDVPESIYWIGAIVDAYDNIVETDKVNNGSSRHGQVTVLNPSALEYPKNEALNVYSNQNSSEWSIDTGNSTEIHHFCIIDFSGKVIYEGQVKGKAIVSTTSFTPGIYLVKVELGKTYETCKMMIK